jgi:hypothetical protein
MNAHTKTPLPPQIIKCSHAICSEETEQALYVSQIDPMKIQNNFLGKINFIYVVSTTLLKKAED